MILRRLEKVVGDQGAQWLHHLADVFQVRSVGEGGGARGGDSNWLWRKDEVVEWLFDTCVSLLGSMDTPNKIQEVRNS